MQLLDFVNRPYEPAALIREFRADLGITLEEYGEIWGISKQAVHSWEKGASDPPAKVIIDIVKYLVWKEKQEGGLDA